MSTLRSVVVLLVSLIGVAGLHTAEPTNLHLYLLVGESNMAGRGVVEPDDRKPHPRVLMLNREGAWVPAIEPCASISFGGRRARPHVALIVADADPSITVGLIPVVAGRSTYGSPRRITNRRRAIHGTTRSPDETCMKAGTLKGILWHQGESNSNAKDAPHYQAKLDDLVAQFRGGASAPDVPFIVGGLGKFDDVPSNAPRKQVDHALRSLPQRVPHSAFVGSEGLKHKGDKVHFDAAGYQWRRYAAAHQKLAQGSP